MSVITARQELFDPLALLWVKDTSLLQCVLQFLLVDSN